ncbi:hypothetical protein [uncultured Robinsoniella sp.]|uniref:ParM/StbA family protein n=1 Tax=uncultured Robinsoniella sp. TaxID=904190 RepID=UPI00374F8D21
MKNVKKDMVIGIDHGYGYMKTAHSIMKSGVKELPVEPPFSHNIIELEGKYYAVGQYIQKHRAVKTDTQDYYILTLAAISEELKRQPNLKCAEIVIAAGLPYSYFSSQKNEFKKYLLQNNTIKYKYEGILYEVAIKDAYVFPQGFPIIAQELEAMKGRVCVVDVGSGTLDILTFQDSQAQHEGCFSVNGGINYCVEQIQKEFLAKYQTEPGEDMIQDYLRGIQNSSIDKEYYRFMDQMVKFYVANNIFGELSAKGINLAFTSMVICGGGTSLVKRYGQGIYLPQSTRFIENIHANAQGYEYLCKGILNGR